MKLALERYLSGEDLPLELLYVPRQPEEWMYEGKELKGYNQNSEYNANLELSPLVDSTDWMRPSTRIKKSSWIAHMSTGTLVTVSYFTGLVAGYCGALLVLKLAGLV